MTVVFFFFKQKTAYEIGLGIPAEPLFRSVERPVKAAELFVSVSCAYTQGKREQFSGFNRTLDAINNVFRRSEERRVGKECRSRWWRVHQKKNQLRTLTRRRQYEPERYVLL